MTLHEAENNLYALRDCTNEKYRLSSLGGDAWSVEVQGPSGRWEPLTEKEINTIIGL